jgi:uncharacterized membrane protein
MSSRLGTIAFLLLLVVLAVFVWRTSQALPPIVASHFSASGAANGFMPRGIYTVLVMALVVGAPLLLALVPAAAAGKGARSLNIPHRDYWLAPERREATVACIRTHGRWFAAAVALFLTYAHWLVVRANALPPPVLSTAGIASGLVVFFLALAVWLAVLFRRFGRRT